MKKFRVTYIVRGKGLGLGLKGYGLTVMTFIVICLMLI